MSIIPALFQLAIIGLAFGGAVVAFYIRQAKLEGEKLICLLDADCEAVVHSRYSTWFGVPLENFGLLYYVALIIFYGGSLFLPALNQLRWVTALVSIASLGAASLSFYLIYVQLQKLQEWCTWCLLSSLFSILIFLATLGLWFG